MQLNQIYYQISQNLIIMQLNICSQKCVSKMNLN